jgi:hypothetical protein
MKKVIRQADYTFSIVSSSYLKSFNCLFEVATSMEDPYWRSRMLPILLPNTSLDDAAILSYQEHWQQEAERLEKTGASPTEVAITQDGARKIGPYLHFVKNTHTDSLQTQIDTQFQKALALMLARQERLEKKGVYRQGIFHLPQGRNRDFTGRDKELSQLEKSLKSGQYSAITNTGMGGVGKSQLALEYAYRHEKEYEMIYWIRSEHLQTVKADLRMLGLEMGVSEDFLKDDKIIPTMRGLLEKRTGWLLIFDNADDPDTLTQALPQMGGHILITSRNPNWRQTVGVDVFSQEEALRYLQKTSGVTGQDHELSLLAKELGHLPLALTQAGAYIRRQQIDVATYLFAYREGQKQLLSHHERGYPGSVATAWQMSIDKITQEDPNALKLLTFCSFLAPDNIPDTVLSAWLKEKNKKESSLDFQDALRILESYSMISQKVEQKEGEHKKAISIHRLIQTVSRDQSEEDESKSTTQLGIDVLRKQFKGDVGSKEARELAETLVEHCIALSAHAENQQLLNEKLGGLVNEIGTFLWRTNDLKGAKKMYERRH